jgi:hypothetical protein
MTPVWQSEHLLRSISNLSLFCPCPPSPGLQGGVEVKEVRLFLLGNGSSGKTSLARALQDPSGRTEPIKVEDRTVGLNVWRGWRPGGDDSDVQVL